MQVWSILAAFLFTQQLPQTELFGFAFWLWLPTAVGAVWCGLYGGYSALRRGRVTGGALTAFAVMLCIVFKVNAQELGYSAVRLALNFGVGQVHIGVNGLGFLYLWWLLTLRKAEERPFRPPADTEYSRSGAV